jgi:hypothetical protein
MGVVLCGWPALAPGRVRAEHGFAMTRPCSLREQSRGVASPPKGPPLLAGESGHGPKGPRARWRGYTLAQR